MKKLLIFLCFSFVLVASELEYKGDIGFEVGYLNHNQANKRDNLSALRFEGEMKREIGDGEFVVKLKAIYDRDDENRRYFDFSDLFYRYNFEDSDILIGRNTRFWGALEFYNITDVFNTKDFLDDPFDYDAKLGAWNVAYTNYIDNGELSLIVKLYEEKQKMQDINSVDYLFPLPYDDKLKSQHSKNRPTIYLKYSGSGDEVQIDYGLVFQNGYDSQRYMSVENQKLVQHAYIVNKLLGYATYIHGDTIYKTELALAQSNDNKVSDYSEVGVGLEHTLYGFWDKRDLGLLVEYYHYNAKDEKKIEFNKIFANDLALGFRLSINDIFSSEVLGGVDLDLDTDEQIYFVEYETRVWEKYKLKTTFTHLEPKEESVFKRLDKAKLEFGYYF